MKSVALRKEQCHGIEIHRSAGQRESGKPPARDTLRLKEKSDFLVCVAGLLQACVLPLLLAGGDIEGQRDGGNDA